MFKRNLFYIVFVAALLALTLATLTGTFSAEAGRSTPTGACDNGAQDNCVLMCKVVGSGEVKWKWFPPGSNTQGWQLPPCEGSTAEPTINPTNTQQPPASSTPKTPMPTPTRIETEETPQETPIWTPTRTPTAATATMAMTPSPEVANEVVAEKTPVCPNEDCACEMALARVIADQTNTISWGFNLMDRWMERVFWTLVIGFGVVAVLLLVALFKKR